MGKRLDDESGRFAPAARVLQLTQAADVSQQIAERQTVVLGKQLHQPIQLGGALVIDSNSCRMRDEKKNI